TLFIGDMEHDIETSRHGGIASCAVLTGYNSLEQLREAGPNLIVEQLGELKLILERQGMRLSPTDAGRPQDVHPIPTVGALVMDERDHLLMVRTHKWSDLWGRPGDKIKRGETAEAALRRELMEETGLEISDAHFVLVQDCIQSPEFYRDAHFVLLNYTCRVSGATEVRLNEEAQEFRWVTMEEAYRLQLNTPPRVLLEIVRSRNG